MAASPAHARSGLSPAIARSPLQSVHRAGQPDQSPCGSTMGAPPGAGSCGETPQSNKKRCRTCLRFGEAPSPLLEAYRRQSADGQPSAEPAEQHSSAGAVVCGAGGEHMLEEQAESPVQQWVLIPPQANAAHEVPASAHTTHSSDQENAGSARPSTNYAEDAMAAQLSPHKAFSDAPQRGGAQAQPTAQALSAAVVAAAAAYEDTVAAGAHPTSSNAHPTPGKSRHGTPRATPHAGLLRSPWQKPAASMRSCDPGAYQPGASEDGQLYTQSHNGMQRSPVATPQKDLVTRKLFSDWG